MKPLKFVIQDSADNQFFVAMVINGEVIMVTETYTQKHNAQEIIQSIINLITHGGTEVIDATKSNPNKPNK